MTGTTLKNQRYFFNLHRGRLWGFISAVLAVCRKNEKGGAKISTTLEGDERKGLRVTFSDLQTHHKRTARLLLSLCALDVYLQYVCRVDGSRRKL